MTFPTATLATTSGGEEKNIVIAVMGATGTGKTSFVNLLSGEMLDVGGELESCTSAVEECKPFILGDYCVTLIDTPGFDDSRLSDSDVLAMIAAHLSHAHKHGRQLAGIIYMHRISDNRMGRIASRNFKMFRHLCGDDSLQNVLIVTNMWGLVDQKVGDARENELAAKTAFYKPALDQGARLARHDGTLESGKSILRALFERRPCLLQIQCELETGMDLSETAAGKQLNIDLMDIIAKHQEEIRKVVDEMNEASRRRDEQSRKELADDRARLESEIRKLQAESRSIATGYVEAIQRLERKMEHDAPRSCRSENSAFDGDVQVCSSEKWAWGWFIRR